VNPYVELGLVVMIPTAVGYGLIFSLRGIHWAVERWPRPRAPVPEPIERLTATLRRLRAELESLETRTGVPNKHLRLRALRAAYMDVLGTAADLGTARPATGPRSTAEPPGCDACGRERP